MEIDGVVYDSKHEAACGQELRLREATGEIRAVERQVPYKIFINGILICTWYCDYRYIEAATGECVVIDCKSEATRKNRVYRIKKKLVEAQFGIIITEV